MPKVRTEEQKILNIPITVRLGGKDWKIAPLVICYSCKWREDFAAVMTSSSAYAQVTSDKPDDFKDALNAMLVGMPNKVIDLFFQYAKDLNREEIEAIATDSEMAKAFDQVVQLAFPLAKSLVGAMGGLSR